MSKKYLIVLKNPPVSFMVDGLDEGKMIIDIQHISCYQDSLSLWIPMNIDCNISYIQEMSDADIEEMQLRIEEMDKQKKEMRAKLLKVKPGFKIPSGKSH